MTQELSKILKNNSGVAADYRHAPKRAKPGDSLELKNATLKWYAVFAEASPVPDEITRLARSYLKKIPLEAAGMGFVILHRCGKDFYFLIVNTWRNNNELWESVFYKDGDAMAHFAPFPRESFHKPTFCVWEMTPLFHEEKAWEQFLNSSRDEAAALTWLNDRYTGEA
jgi:hypothetical protein